MSDEKPESEDAVQHPSRDRLRLSQVRAPEATDQEQQPGENSPAGPSIALEDEHDET